MYIYESNESEAKNNHLKFKICTQQGEKKEWTWSTVNFKMFNKQQCVCFPYVYFLYNHDQVYMKDLTKINGQGYYYLNHFLGIQTNQRALTLHANSYNNKMSLNVPCVKSNYTAKDYFIQNHQIKTTYQSSQPFNWIGKLRYRVYAYNQNLISVWQDWAHCITDNQGILHSDIRIFHRNNGLFIEKWEKQRCVHRVITTNYNEPYDPATRDPSDPKISSLFYKQRGMWLILVQTNETIQAYTREMRYSFHVSDLLQLEERWDFANDDQSNLIYDIVVDPFVKDYLGIYVIFQNATMRKFSAQIPVNSNGEHLKFEENMLTYNVEFLNVKSNSQSSSSSGTEKGSSAAASKKINLFDTPKHLDIFIANNLLYSQQGIYDLNLKHTENKMQVGMAIKTHLKNVSDIKNFTFSFNQARVAAIYKHTELQGDSYTSHSDLIVLVSPLLNSRLIPQFYHRQFKHVAVPMVDQKRGLTSVFTLNLDHIYTQPYHYDYSDYSYHDNCFSHHGSIYHRFEFNSVVSPGILIKYFNGIEQKIPIKERFLNIIRFHQSKDGKFAVIMGTLKGDINDLSYNKDIKKRDIHHGIFLYQISLQDTKLIKSFLFAEKDPKKMNEDTLKKLLNPIQNLRKYVEPELDHPQIGEYEYAGYITEAIPKMTDYIKEINFKDTDEDYVDILKRKREEKKILLMKQQQNNRKSFMQKMTDQHDEDEDEEMARLDTQEREEKKKKEEEELVKAGKLEEGEELKDVTRLRGVVELFKGFDIPWIVDVHYNYKEFVTQWRNHDLMFEEENNQGLLTEQQLQIKANAPKVTIDENTPKYDNDVDLHHEFGFEQDEIDKIKSIHANMHMMINEQGYIFLINRLNNKLYFFNNESSEAKCIKFEADFPILYADNSNGYIVVWNDTRFQIIEENAQFNNKVYFDSKKYEQLGVNKDIVGTDSYNYTIKYLVINGDKIILRISDDDCHYVKVFDYVNKRVLYYIESQHVLISGDKNYIWMIQDRQVYDLQNGLATFFFWPGELINTHTFDGMDVFNVSSDRTILSTLGYMALTFSQISFNVSELMNKVLNDRDFLYYREPFCNSTNMFSYLCYKISDYRSLLENIFENDWDKMSKEGFLVDPSQEEVKPEEKHLKLIAQQQLYHKQIQAFLHFLTNCYNPEKNNPSEITQFFFTYYYAGSSKNLNQKFNIFQKLYNHLDSRVDLIEDILQYVVGCTTVPITQNVINTCFTNFLENANTSKAFRQYLENITVQTSKMEDIENFQIQSKEEGFIAEAHDSPIIDDRFYTKVRQMRESKKDVEVHYINLGNLLSIKGEEIMDMLSDKKFLSLMDIPFIKYFVMYQWINIKKKIQYKLLYPFFALLGLFSIYSLYFVNYSDDVIEELSALQAIFNYTNIGLLVAVLFYFMFIEVRQCILDPKDYFTSFWNLSDLVSYLLCLMVILFDNLNVKKSITRPTSALCLIILWIRMFYFLRVYDTTARLIRMIIEIVNDMKNFLIVLLIGVLGFTGGLFILQQGLGKDSDGNLVRFAGEDRFKAFIYTYRMALGDFQLDNFNDFEGAGLTFEYYLVWIIFMIGSLFLVIVLMNLLIAIMGDTFGRVLESIQNMVIREKVLLVSENESLFDRDQLFGRAQYLIIITEKSLEGDSGDNWDGQITMLRRQLVDKVTNLEKELQIQLTESQQELKKRFADNEDRQKKISIATEQKIQGHVKVEAESTVFKMTEILTTLQQQIARVQTQVSQDQNRSIRMLQDQIETMKNEQTKTTQHLYKALNITVKNSEVDEE